jgi:hypothetical protein
VIYEFKCDSCGATEDVDRPLREGPPKELDCSCGGRKHRVWQSSAIIIPEYMKAAESQDFSTWKTRMAKSRPSGRDRIYY